MLGDNELHCSSYEYGCMKITRGKYSDHLVDSCKHSSINQIAEGLRSSDFSHGILYSFSNFSYTPYMTSLNRHRSRSLTDLQCLCCKALNVKLYVSKIKGKSVLKFHKAHIWAKSVLLIHNECFISH